MHTITFYNIGSADCIRVKLDNDKTILFDFAHMGDPDVDEDLRCDLPQRLREDLGDRKELDVVAFTHLDRDHYAGATDFFYFDHIKEYQDDVDGEPRIKMHVMWVPAAVITETLKQSADHEAKAIQREARERFRAMKGIRVFSRPERLEEWCKSNELSLDARRHLVTDAGKTAPGFTLADDGVEFFVHSPFAMRQDEHTVEDRNNDALAMHVTFEVDGKQSRVFLTSDLGHECLTEIVRVTESKRNHTRLEWDVFKLPHHCSHHSLSDKDRDGDKSEPVPDVKRLFEDYGQQGCVVVSTSNPIPAAGDDADEEGAKPPHRQAANYYKEDVVADGGEFLVTMEHPSKSNPSPLVIEIDGAGPTVKRARRTAAVAATTTFAPRAG